MNKLYVLYGLSYQEKTDQQWSDYVNECKSELSTVLYDRKSIEPQAKREQSEGILSDLGELYDDRIMKIEMEENYIQAVPTENREKEIKGHEEYITHLIEFEADVIKFFGSSLKQLNSHKDTQTVYKRYTTRTKQKLKK